MSLKKKYWEMTTRMATVTMTMKTETKASSMTLLKKMSAIPDLVQLVRVQIKVIKGSSNSLCRKVQGQVLIIHKPTRALDNPKRRSTISSDK
jgi:hypothetical protein